MTLESDLLQRLRPSVEAQRVLDDKVQRMMVILRERIAARGLSAEPILVGSVAKGTHLGANDVDLFVAFPPETPRDVLETEGLALGTFLEGREKMFAEHPYTHGYFEGVETEIVPCFRISDPSQKMSAVDRTPFHAKYVIDRITDAQRDQVRLLKAFCKGTSTYGAESRVQGFSGYLCELLGLRFGTFAKVLEAAALWTPPIHLELDRKASRDFPEPLVLIDPIDGGRNVASAVSAATLGVFVHAAQAYRQNPTERFFFPRPPRVLTAKAAATVLARRGGELLAVALKAPQVTEDVLFPQARKAFRALEELLERQGFALLGSRFALAGGDLLFLFELEVSRLPAVVKHDGPPAGVRNAADFLAKWQGSKEARSKPFLEDGHWAVHVRREHPTATSLIRGKLPTLSLGKNLDAEAARARVLTGKAALRTPWLGEITALLDPMFPWDR